MRGARGLRGMRCAAGARPAPGVRRASCVRLAAGSCLVAGMRTQAGTPFTMRVGPHHVQGGPALLALHVHAACKRDGQHEPHHGKRRHERRAPVAQEGQRLSRDGQQPHDAAHVHAGLEGDHHRKRACERASEQVGGIAAYAYARVGEQGEEKDYGDGAHQPELLAYDGEDEVGVGIGQVEVLFLGQPEARAVHPAERERIERLYGLVARVARVAPGVDEGLQALEVVGLHDADEDSVGGDEGKAGEHHLPREAGEHGGSEQAHEQDDDGAKVGLAEDEEDGHGDGDGERNGETAQLEAPLAVHDQKAAHGKDRGDLRELGGLYSHPRDDDGALGAEGLGAESYLRGHEEQSREHPQAAEKQRMRPEAVGHACEEQAKERADEEIERLAAHVEGGVSRVAVGLHRRGRVDHDQAYHAQEHHRDDEEQTRHHDLCRGAHEARDALFGRGAARGGGWRRRGH